MDFRRKAIELYKEGKTEKEISQIIGIEIKGETVSRWMMEDDLKRRKSEIAKLDRKVKDSALDYTKKQGYLVRLKELLEEILKIIPNDVEMRIKLMYTCIGLKMIEEAEKIGYSLNEETDSSNIRILNGLTIVEEKKENYDKAIEFTKKIIEIQSNNEFYKNKLKKLEKRKQEKGEKNEKELIYEEIKKLEKNMKKETEKRLGRKVIKGEKYNESEIANEVRVETYMEIQRLAMELLKKYPYEIFAREKLIKSLYNTKQIQQVETEAMELLEREPNNMQALRYMAEIAKEKGDLDGEKNYRIRIMENSSGGYKDRAEMKLANVESKIKKREESNKDVIFNNEYTEEKRIEWLENLEKEYWDRGISREKLDKELEKAKKYPNYIKSWMKIITLKVKLTEEYQENIEQLEKYVDTNETLTSEEYNDILDEIGYLRERIKEQKLVKIIENRRNYEESNEQRLYSKIIVTRLKKGEITSEEIPDIVKKLEQFKDKSRAVFLITKLYEIIDGRERALENLGKYTHIMRLSENEMENLVKMQKVLTEKPRTFGATHKIKGIYNNNSKRYSREIMKNEIVNEIKQNRTVKQILESMKEKGVTLKSVSKIRTHFLKKNEDYAMEHQRLCRYAKNLLRSGYNIEQVYEIMEYDISLSRLKEISQEILKEREDTK